jgi:glutamate synthase domain-containing protein 2
MDGQLKTVRDVMIAALLGVEEFDFATALLIAKECIMTSFQMASVSRTSGNSNSP